MLAAVMPSAARIVQLSSVTLPHRPVASSQRISAITRVPKRLAEDKSPRPDLSGSRVRSLLGPISDIGSHRPGPIVCPFSLAHGRKMLGCCTLHAARCTELVPGGRMHRREILTLIGGERRNSQQPACSTGDGVRNNHQSESRSNASSDCARPRRRGHRVTAMFAAMHESGFAKNAKWRPALKLSASRGRPEVIGTWSK